jgi:hypothetical protein
VERKPSATLMEYCKDPMGPPLRMKGIQLHGRTRKSHLVVTSEARKGRVSSLRPDP